MKIKGLRWWIIGLVALGTAINYLARSSLSVAASTLFTELHITEQQYSWVIMSFQMAYTLAQSVCGYILDSIGLRIGFFIFALAWSFANMAHALAINWQSLAFCRGLLGLSESAAIPAGIKATSEWFPSKERGIAGGLFNIGTSLGAMLAPPIVVWAIIYMHWQFAFIFTGSFGLIFAFLWLFLYRPPEKHKWISEEEKQYIAAGQEKELQSDGDKRPPLRALLKQRNFWGIAMTRFLSDPVWGTLSFWLPLYLIQVRHLPLKEIAMFAWLPFLAADIGCVAGGVLSNLLITKFNVTTVNSRRIGFTIGALLMTSLSAVGFVENVYFAIALISLGGFAHQMLSTMAMTLASDLFKKNQVATVSCMAGSAAWLGQLLFTMVMGLLVHQIGYTPFFIALSILDLIAAAIIWLTVIDPQRAVREPILTT
ncbi:MFS transporter [Klebsiella pneumoniae]|uniref:MFS transporter n=1 Tax=Klebsiella pneumoniae TaxID=573 RepID=UPI000808CFAA|nr:MFS transporter [Klebsiella pneumoniae]HDU3659839.1 MFS transporter [Klebsiella pneumoniae subsp. pneumoniae]ELN9411810.1 MFS transporter [Klebsiella pneumoniae]SCA03628.1 Hexuronate transporter [Klebsiella pneumoniae]HBQ5636930.1 MFS transporter [Klebsiella pneumoniae]HBV2421165.1 MFS transporter [Klebsiella pneumoniae]